MTKLKNAKWHARK